MSGVPEAVEIVLYRLPGLRGGDPLLAEGVGVPVAEMLSRVRAGDSPESVAADFDVRPESLALLLDLASALRKQFEEELLGDEAVRATARERFDYLSGYSGTRWEEAHESIRRQEEDKARLFLRAAIQATHVEGSER